MKKLKFTAELFHQSCTTKHMKDRHRLALVLLSYNLLLGIAQ